MFDTVLRSSTILSDVTITFFLNHKSMTAKRKMHQPRRILESKLLKHLHNTIYINKINKYIYLSREYDLI